MSNEYVIYWKREVVYRTKLVADNEDEAIDLVCNGFSDDKYEEEIEGYGDMEIESIDLIEKDTP